jgi:hypothetical protein
MVTLVGPSAGALVREASDAWLGAGAHAVSLTVLNIQALLYYRHIEPERTRRRHARAARLDRIDALQTLLRLPVGHPLEWEAVGADLRAAVRRLPAGSVERDRRQVVRRAVRPLTVDLAVVRVSGRNWRAGLRRAGRFAPFCSRALLVDPPPRDSDEFVMEAAFYGIGVLWDAGDGLRMVLEPRAYRPPRHTAAAWCFTEELYQRLG